MTEQTKEQEMAKAKERQREVALENLKSGLWDYALPAFATSEQYGKLAEVINGKYNELLKKTPAQDVYEKVFYPALKDKTKSINTPYIQETSSRILQESLLSIKAEDLMQYLGSKKSVDNKNYQGKYIGDIKDEKVRIQMVASAISTTVNNKIQDILGESNKKIVSELEKIVCDVPTENQAANNSDYALNAEQVAA